MYAPVVWFRDTMSPSIMIFSEPRGACLCILMPSVTHLYCTEHTDSTSGMRRLNSSKQPQAPEEDRPLKMLPRDW